MTHSESYWRHEQDVTADIVRQMDEKCKSGEDPDLKEYCEGGMRGEKWLAFPNVFITIAPGEWNMAMHMSTKAFKKELSEVQSILTLHLYQYLTDVVKQLLESKFFEKVFHYVIRYEFQGRGTLHLHIAIWCLPDAARPIASMIGRSRQQWSPLVELLEKLCHASIDVQEGSGHLNYINGYTTKASEALDFNIAPYAAKSVDHKWLTTYRLLSKTTPLIPEVVLNFGQLPHMTRSFHVGTVHAPAQLQQDESMRKDMNNSDKLYNAYLKHMANQELANMSFVQFARAWNINAAGDLLKRSDKKITAVGVRYRYETNDRFLGEFAVMMFPHSTAHCFRPAEAIILTYTEHYVGVMKFLQLLTWTDDGNVQNEGKCAADKFPEPLPAAGPGEKVFPTDQSAHDYLCNAILKDLEMRGIGNGRRRTFVYRLEAVRLFSQYASSLKGHERDCALQEWNMQIKPDVQAREWSEGQKQLLAAIEQNMENTDPDANIQDRMISLSGKPGSGKSEVMAHGAILATQNGGEVLILTPTGAQLNSYREKLGDREHISIETVHSGFAIRRQADEVVQYAPPTRLRKYDIIFIDEASQIDDDIFKKIIIALRELPQKPVIVIAHDMKQLRPIGSGRMMASMLSRIKTQIELTTIYRSNDPAHLLFLNTIRDGQPEKTLISQYFGARKWTGDLETAVRKGMAQQKTIADAFVWLTVSNDGAAKVNDAALRVLGVSEEDKKYACRADPQVAKTRIVAKKGIIVRLTRNNDKARGFVNGAIGEIVTVLSPQCFTVRLRTGRMVLVHAMCGNKEMPFLPCTYGYATTIRRAQGMTLSHGCVYFDLHFPPDRGYAYVAVSRFRTKSGVYHYGKIRRSDWLAIDEKETDQIKRSEQSMSTDSDECDNEGGMFGCGNSSESDSCESERERMWCHNADESDNEGGMFGCGNASAEDDMAMLGDEPDKDERGMFGENAESGEDDMAILRGL